MSEARIAAPLFGRTPAAQIEYWAKLGKVAEGVFSSTSIKKLKSAARIENPHQTIKSANSSEGRRRFVALVRSKGEPLYRPVPAQPGIFVEARSNESELRGYFKNRRLLPVRAKAKGQQAG